MVDFAKGAMIRVIHVILFGLTLLPHGYSWASVQSSQEGKEVLPVVRLSVALDMPNHRVYGQADIEIPEDRPVRVFIGTLKAEQITLGGRPLRPVVEQGAFRVAAMGRGRILRMRFSGVFPRTRNRSNFIAPDGVVLIDDWHPRVRGLAVYQLTAIVSSSQRAISQADAITAQSNGKDRKYTFDFPHPRTEVSLVAGPYEVVIDQHGPIQLAAYFFPEDQDLARGYLEKAKTYIDRYEELLGPYPFRRFAIVENRQPTGYGMATYTLMGQRVVRLPFIVDTSLGHEILHSWFGNSVYTDPNAGNWSEALTTYLSDHLYEVEKGKGGRYRHRLLMEYRSYVHGDKVMRLSQFKARTDRATQAVGYGKGAMVFHMLRHVVGEDAFFNSLRVLSKEYRFRFADWRELRTLFEQSSGKDLAAFFHQWLARTDIPVLTLERGQISPLGGSRYRVIVSIGQHTNEPYELTVPVVVETSHGQSRRNMWITEAEQSVTLEVDGRPSAVVVDPDYDLMRDLGPEEYPPVLSRLLGAGRRIVVSPVSQQGQSYRSIIQGLKRRGFHVLRAAEVTQRDMAGASFLILGNPEGPLWRLVRNLPPVEEGVLLTVRENPFSRQEVVAVLQAGKERDIPQVVPKLSHYGRYGTLKFRGDRLVERKIPQSERGLRLTVQGDILGLSARDLSSVKRIVEQVTSRRVIYVGEEHNQYGHHLAQLELIKALVREGRQVAVGMEMFQRPYQPAIDQYLNGTIDERTFLAQTEYFKRWQLDYNLYRPIVEYCKAQGLPLVALNLPTAITRKVARQGLGALTEPERQQIPQDLDFSNRSYRARLKRVFKKHPKNEVRDFDTFYQSQVLWDETMAQTVHEFLKVHTDYQMVVLAGSGHLAYGDGIPARVRRRGGYDQVIILNVGDGNPSPEMADYFLYPLNASPPFTAKLGVYLKEEGGHLSIERVARHGLAQRAGVRAGDLLVAFDGKPLRTLPELRLELFFKKAEDTAQVRLKRKRTLLAEEVLDITVGPFRTGMAARQDPRHAPSPAVGQDEKTEDSLSDNQKERSPESGERARDE